MGDFERRLAMSEEEPWPLYFLADLADLARLKRRASLMTLDELRALELAWRPEAAEGITYTVRALRPWEMQ